MKKKSTLALLVILVCLMAPFSSAQATHATTPAPVIRKVEPPNWWTNYTPNLTLLITGENLSDAHVESATPGASVLGAESSANGHYIFVHMQLTGDVKAGNVDLRVHTAAGSTLVQLPLRDRADSRGHFENFSRNDVIYLIMPDRFADGDPFNDRPPGTTGIYDRGNPHAYHGGDLRG